MLEARKIEREARERRWDARNPLGTPPEQTSITGMFYHMRLFNQDTFSMRALVVVDRLHAVTDDDEFSSYLEEMREETRLWAGAIPGSEKTWMREGI